MTTELIKEEIFTKITLKGSQKDLATNEQNSFETKGIKSNSQITYLVNDDHYILKVLNPYQLILTRENNTIKNILYFKQNKTIPSSYLLKEQDITLEIDIRTDLLEITEHTIKIIYTVIDSNNQYEYKIEMSE